ncbi:MAG: hypothetical protein KJ018_10585 [Burkholderiales bacterium]|nr:hypothetical protein [Burkholderiales bacterium]
MARRWRHARTTRGPCPRWPSSTAPFSAGPLAAAVAGAARPTPEQGFVVRTLLVHEYRRARLRDPQLPPELLPADWPGAQAYALCRDVYRAAEPLAREHLARALDDEGEALLPALPEFLTRFAQE